MRKTLAILLCLMIIINAQIPVSAHSDHLNKYYKSYKLSKEDKDFLDGLGTLKVLVDDDFAPISYYDKDTKSFAGIAVDVLEILSEILDFDYEIIRDETLSFSDRLDKIKNNEIDLLGGVSRNEERQKYGYFTDLAYFKVNYALIGSIKNHIRLRNINEIAYYRIGLVKDVTINDYILNAGGQNASIIYYETLEDAFEGLKRNEVDFIPDNEAVFTEEYFNGKRFDYEIIYSIYDVIKYYAYFSPKTEVGEKLTKILTTAIAHIHMDKVINGRYENKSIFMFYKEYNEKLQKSNNLRNIIILFLLFISLMTMIFIIIINKKNKQLNCLAITDSLTKLKNRHALYYDYEDNQKLKNKLICYIDLDDFKIINDTYGHEAGDLVLKKTADRLNAFFQSNNIYRMGGDEFLIIENETIEFDGKLLLELIQKPIKDKNKEYKVNVSSGYIYSKDIPSISLNEMIKLADETMIKAKSMGKNNILKWEEKKQ